MSAVRNITGNAYQFLFLAFLFFLSWLFPFIKVHPGYLVPCKSIKGTSNGLPSLTFRAFTTDCVGSSSFSMERIVAALRCNSEPKCPRSFNPLGTKCKRREYRYYKFLPVDTVHLSLPHFPLHHWHFLQGRRYHLSPLTVCPHIGNRTYPYFEQWRADVLSGHTC